MSRNKKFKAAGAPPWMTTFADLMALMLTFFVLLLSMSTTDLRKYQEALFSIQQAFGKPMHGYMTGSGTGKIIGDAVQLPKELPRDEVETESQKIADTTERLYQKLTAAMQAEIDAHAIEVHKYDDKVLIRFQELIAFDLASARLRSNFIPILDKVSQTLSGIDGSILVVGHTDDLPITTARFRSNWDLSAARAASVVHRMLNQANLSAADIIAAGRADTVPLVSNDSPANRAKNRRVEIVVTLGDITRGETEQSN